jgi:hypothetical protein
MEILNVSFTGFERIFKKRPPKDIYTVLHRTGDIQISTTITSR